MSMDKLANTYLPNRFHMLGWEFPILSDTPNAIGW